MKLVKPMLLKYQEEVRSDEGWLYEPKFDGIRLLVGNDYSYTRHGTITTSRFLELRFDGHELFIDGELIAPGINAPDDFAGSMSRFGGNNNQPIFLKAFDILSFSNKSVTYYPLKERKAILTEGLTEINSPYITVNTYIYTEGEALFNVMKKIAWKVWLPND